MRRVIYRALLSAPFKIGGILITVGGAVSSVFPDKVRAVLNTTTIPIQSVGIVALIVGILYFALLWLLKPGEIEQLAARTISESTADTIIMGDVHNYGHTEAPSSSKNSDHHYEQCVALIEEIDEFIAKKDEVELRSTFDFTNILEYNLKKAMCDFRLGGTDALATDVNRYFQGGQAVGDVRYAKMTVINGRLDIQPIPGNMGFLNTSLKFVEAKAHLDRLIQSAITPDNIRDALVKFNGTIDRNITLMIESINRSLAQNTKEISENFSYGAAYYGSASGRYWQLFEHLRPKVEDIRKEIRTYVKIA